MAVYGRRVSLALGQAGQTGKALTDLRVSFEVQMSRGTAAHTAKIRLYNALPTTLAALDGTDPTVLLQVGYGDPLVRGGGAGIPRTIFLGKVIRNGLKTQREATDRITTIEARDTPGVYEAPPVQLVYSQPVSHADVVRAVAGALGVSVGALSLPVEITLTQGGTFSGNPRTILDTIAASAGATWWVSDGVLYMAGEGEAVAAAAPSFSATQGNLIGSPEKKDRRGVKIRGLLDATMRPGRLFVVDSPTLSGTFVATDVRFVGDSWEGPFYVELIGRPRA